MGIDPGRLSKWRQNQQEGNIIYNQKPGLTEEQLEIRRLQKELKEAQVERDSWSRCSQRRQVQKGGQHHESLIRFLQGRGQIFRFIKEHREVFSVEKMCRVMNVSVSGY